MEIRGASYKLWHSFVRVRVHKTTLHAKEPSADTWQYNTLYMYMPYSKFVAPQLGQWLQGRTNRTHFVLIWSIFYVCDLI